MAVAVEKRGWWGGVDWGLTAIEIVRMFSNMTTNAIPNVSRTARDTLRMARELDVPGVLVRRGRKYETRAYAVRLESGALMQDLIIALPAEHYTGSR